MTNETHRLPMVSSEPPAPAPRILLVEDSEDDALLLQIDLQPVTGPTRFHRVDTEPGMRSALADGEWDLIICDHAMPGFDSRRALEIAKAMAPDTPFVICSGNIDATRALAAMRDGAQDWVDKRDRARLLPVVERELKGVKVRRDKVRAEASVIELAHYDSLTRLPNRDSLIATIDAAIAGGEHGAAPVLLVFDVDRFRRVNESWGMEAGDAMIRDIGLSLAGMTGKRSALARLGQNKFAAFLASNPAERTARAFANRLAQRFTEGFQASGNDMHFTISTGLALFPNHGSSGTALLANAECALHSVKAAGGNSHRLYDPAMNSEALHRTNLENALHFAVDREELALAWQPVTDLATSKIIGAEALLRWNHPGLGVVLPGDFITLAEETGQICQLGRWAMRRALAETRAIRDRGFPEFFAAVNVSAVQFREPGFVAEVLSALATTGLPASALEIEITESIAMEASANTLAQLRELRAVGVRIALDDFGTGYSSMAYLKQFPFDVLKIDRSFVDGLPASREDAAIFASMNALAQGLGLELHAEGIERDGQRLFLAEAGCQRGQGYFIGKPMPAGDLLTRMTR